MIILSLLLYVATFILSAALVFIGYKYRVRLLTVFGVLIVALLGFLRYGIGADYANYLMSYQFYADGEMFDLGIDNHNFNLEPFFPVVANISHWLTGSPLLFFGIPWVLTIVLVFFGIRRLLPEVSSRDFSLIWLLSLSLVTPFAFDQMRQTLAIAVFFFAIPYVVHRKAVKYAVAVILASTIHTSSIIIMPLSYILGRWIIRKGKRQAEPRYIKQSLRRMYILGIISVGFLYVISILNLDLLLGLHLPYIDELIRLLHGGGSIKLGVDEIVPFALFSLTAFSMHRFMRKYDKLSSIIQLFLTIGAILAPLSIFISLGGRLAQYYLLLIPIAIYLITTSRRVDVKKGITEYQRVFTSPYLLLSLSFLSIVAFTGWTRIIPYVSIFNSGDAITSKTELAPFYAAMCELGIKKDCFVEDGKMQKDNRIWRP